MPQNGLGQTRCAAVNSHDSERNEVKTPEQWLASKTHCVNRNVITDRFKAKDIADIQSDAREGMVPAALLSEALSLMDTPEHCQDDNWQDRRNAIAQYLKENTK